MDNIDNLTQSIVGKNLKSFIIYKQFKKSVGVVSTFCKTEKGFETHLINPKNRIHRIEHLYKTIPELCSYETNEDFVRVDCVNGIYQHTDIFTEVPEKIYNGTIHFSLTRNNIQKDNDKSVNIIDVDPILIINNEYEMFNEKQIKLDDLPKFETEKMKIFTVLLKYGYIISITNKNESILQFTLYNPKDNYIGPCNCNKENILMMKNLNLLWPIFKTEHKKIGETSWIDIYITDHVTNNMRPISTGRVIQLSRELKSKYIQTSFIGKILYKQK